MKFDFLKIESYKKGIILSSLFNLLSKGLLFVQNIAIAYYFGAQAKTDMYFYAFAMITLASVFINSLDSSVLVPESMRLLEQEGKEKAVRFLNVFIYGYFFIGLLATAIFYISPVDILLVLSNFDAANLSQGRDMFILCIPLFTLMITTNLLVNILYSFKYFTVPMIVGVLNGVIVLTFLLLLHGDYDIRSVLIGQIIAYLINIFFLILLMKRNTGWDFSIKKIKIEKRIFKNIAFSQVGNITSFLSSYIPMYLLSGFGPGIITSLTYGQKTADIPNQLITAQFSSIVGIKLNELYAKTQYVDLNRIFLSVAKDLLFVLIPISALIFIYSTDIISLFFERGFFDDASVGTSSLFLKYLGLLLPLLAINTLVTRLFMAGQKVKEAFGYQLFLNALLIILIIAGVSIFGINGYLCSLLLIHGANLFFLFYLLKVVMPFVDYAKILLYFIRILGVNVCVAVMVLYFNKYIMPEVHPLLNVFTGAFIYVVLIMVINYFAKLNESLGLVFQVIRKIKF